MFLKIGHASTIINLKSVDLIEMSSSFSGREHYINFYKVKEDGERETLYLSCHEIKEDVLREFEAIKDILHMHDLLIEASCEYEAISSKPDTSDEF